MNVFLFIEKNLRKNNHFVIFHVMTFVQMLLKLLSAISSLQPFRSTHGAIHEIKILEKLTKIVEIIYLSKEKQIYYFPLICQFELFDWF